MNEYYTYAYLREDGTPYYIGKGIGYRLTNNSSRKGLKCPKDKSRVIKLKQNLTEEEAFRHEIYMIAVYGRKDLGKGILHNRTNGGDGASGRIQTDKTKKLMSEKASGANNPMYGKPHTEEHKQKISNSLKGITPWNKGKKHPPETIEKIRQSCLKKSKIKN
jgi:hypothetical protein